MRGRLWRWASALLAAICGVAFGLLAGMGMVRAAELPRAMAAPLLAGSVVLLALYAGEAMAREGGGRGQGRSLPLRGGVMTLPARRSAG